jgi:hypothetical protein
MSDIYLQITETPTVVTLSAPVVSGALASTVTVANTVTVALDSNSLSALENVTVTVGAAITGTVTVANFPATQAVSLASVPTHGVTLASTTVTVSSLPAISGTVTAMAGTNFANEIYNGIFNFSENDQLGVYVTSALPAGSNNIGRMTIDAGTNRIGVVTIGGGTVTIGAGTAQIGSVTVGNSVTIGSLPAIAGTVTANVNSFPDATTIGEQIAQGFTNYGSFEVAIGGTANVAGTVTIGAGTAQIGSVTASISNTVVTFYPLQGTTATNTNFTSTNPSTTLVSAVAGREVLTVFNEGAGNLHISAGGICTTTAYQVRLSAGDYWECPAGQLSLAHTAVFATAGTARVTEVS